MSTDGCNADYSLVQKRNEKAKEMTQKKKKSMNVYSERRGCASPPNESRSTSPVSKNNDVRNFNAKTSLKTTTSFICQLPRMRGSKNTATE